MEASGSCSFKTESHIAQASFELLMPLLLHLECWITGMRYPMPGFTWCWIQVFMHSVH